MSRRNTAASNVAQIITFGTMAAKAAIKDVGRAMDIPYAEVDRIAKMVPTAAQHHTGPGDRRTRRSYSEAVRKRRRRFVN